MQRYYVKNHAFASDPTYCEQFLDAMVKEGFELVRVKAGATFCFEYSEKRHRYRYYCVPGAAASFFNQKLNSVTLEIKRVFPAAEIANVGSAMRIIRLDYRAGKEKTYLDRLANEYGLDEFDEDAYLERVKKKRDLQIRSGAWFLLIIMIIFAMSFVAIAICSLWWFAFFAIIPVISMISSVRLLINANAAQ